MRLFEKMDKALDAADPSKPFLVVDGAATTYGALADKMARLHAVFAGKGLVAGDQMGIVSESAVDVAALLLAGLRHGLAVVNLNPAMTAVECAHALRAADVTHVFLDRARYDAGPLPAGIGHTVIEPATRKPGGTLLAGLFRKGAPQETATGLAGELMAAEPGKATATPDDGATALMLFTSGTTSTPKVVELSQANLGAQIDTFLKVYDYDADSRILNPLPLHFTDGLLHGPIIAFLTGATLYRPKQLDFTAMGDLLHGIYRDRISHFIVVPALLAIIDRLHDDFKTAFDTPDFRYIRSSGDRLPDALWSSIQERFGVRVVNTYGLSETVCEALFCGPNDDLFRFGTIGRPVDCAIDIRNEDGQSLGDGETGELVISGANIMKGYLNQPDLTADVISDGWFKTGDFAVRDADGFVRIVGRKKALIISGGVNIQPQDINDALLSHEGVVEAFAYGVPDLLWGDVAACAVVLRDGFVDLTPDALIEHSRTQLAAHKVPRLLTVVDALPRNPAGKVLVEELRKRHALDGGGSDVASSASLADGNLEDAVLAVAARVFSCPVDTLRLTSEPRTTLGWDSFAHLGLVGAMEETFNVEFSPSDILKIGCLGDIVAILERHSGRKGVAL
ncbi:MAG: AMP-binding protein [Pseudomonadota bacterium]